MSGPRVQSDLKKAYKSFLIKTTRQVEKWKKNEWQIVSSGEKTSYNFDNLTKEVRDKIATCKGKINILDDFLEKAATSADDKESREVYEDAIIQKISEIQPSVSNISETLIADYHIYENDYKIYENKHQDLTKELKKYNDFLSSKQPDNEGNSLVGLPKLVGDVENILEDLRDQIAELKEKQDKRNLLSDEEFAVISSAIDMREIEFNIKRAFNEINSYLIPQIKKEIQEIENELAPPPKNLKNSNKNNQKLKTVKKQGEKKYEVNQRIEKSEKNAAQKKPSDSSPIMSSDLEQIVEGEHVRKPNPNETVAPAEDLEDPNKKAKLPKKVNEEEEEKNNNINQKLETSMETIAAKNQQGEKKDGSNQEDVHVSTPNPDEIAIHPKSLENANNKKAELLKERDEKKNGDIDQEIKVSTRTTATKGQQAEKKNTSNRPNSQVSLEPSVSKTLAGRVGGAGGATIGMLIGSIPFFIVLTFGTSVAIGFIIGGLIGRYLARQCFNKEAANPPPTSQPLSKSEQKATSRPRQQVGSTANVERNFGFSAGFAAVGRTVVPPINKPSSAPAPIPRAASKTSIISISRDVPSTNSSPSSDGSPTSSVSSPTRRPS